MPNRPLIIRAQSAVAGLVLFVDGFPDHRHRLSSRIGGEPLEDGAEVTDHVIAAPETLSLTGTVSDMGGSQRPQAAWEAIQRIHKASETVRVITEWAIYPEMVIASCDGQPDGRGMTFTMELRDILRVSSATTAASAVPPSAQAGTALGRSAEVSRGRVGLLARSAAEESAAAARSRANLTRIFA